MLFRLFCGLALVCGLPNLGGAQTPATQSLAYNVRAYGAVGDGKALDSNVINAAIEAAAAAAVGGGRVYLPACDYLSGAIRLKSSISLYLEQGATIIATADNPGAVYDQAEPSAPTILVIRIRATATGTTD